MKQPRTVLLLTTQALVLATLSSGCGGGSSGGPPIAPVDGVVIVDGKPKAGLNVTFHPEGGGRPATALTNADGSFEMTTFNTGDGAIVGKHSVSISAGSGEEDASPPMPGFPGHEEWLKKQREMIDPKYGDPKTSGFTFTVPEGGLSDVEIKIP